MKKKIASLEYPISVFNKNSTLKHARAIVIIYNYITKILSRIVFPQEGTGGWLDYCRLQINLVVEDLFKKKSPCEKEQGNPGMVAEWTVGVWALKAW